LLLRNHFQDDDDLNQRLIKQIKLLATFLALQ